MPNADGDAILKAANHGTRGKAPRAGEVFPMALVRFLYPMS